MKCIITPYSEISLVAELVPRMKLLTQFKRGKLPKYK